MRTWTRSRATSPCSDFWYLLPVVLSSRRDHLRVVTRPGHPLEQAVGMQYYASASDGIGGNLRVRDEDFRVREVEAFDVNPIEEPPGDYAHLVLRVTLTGWDTNDFARELSNRLGMSRERVDWAGTKDRNAVTTQLFTVQSGDPDAVRAVEIENVDIELIGRAGRSIYFGDLAGNEFEVTVRAPEADDPATAADAITEELYTFAGSPEDGRVGVPNFFGQQRFGSIRPVTHEVGLAVLRGDWEGAVMAYLGNPSGDEPTSTQDARQFVEDTRDWQRALDEFPNHLRYERTMLHSLAETGDDYRTALETFPSNLQSMFVNAAQSYAFNEILSRRMERDIPFHEPVEGDVVCFADSDAPEGLALPDTNRQQTVSGKRVDTVARHCKRNRAFVTAPLVGTDTEFADGEPGDIAHEVLDELDVTTDDFDLPGDWSSSGTRRAILVTTDIGVEPESAGSDALTFEFTLPKGSYATVFLREYLKVSPLEMG